MSNKWTSRKWLLTVFGELVAIVVAGAGAIYGEQEVLYAGLALMPIIAGSYLKAEKDVDMARAETEAAELYHICHCKECQPKADG